MLNRFYRLMSQGSGVALAAVFAISLAGHMTNGAAVSPNARSATVAAMGNLPGTTQGRASHFLVKAAFHSFLIHRNG